VPSLANSFNVNSTAANTATLSTSSFAPAVGDVIVVKGSVENDHLPALNTPTDTQGNTYTLQVSDTTSSHCGVWLWTAVAGSISSMSVSMSGGPSGWHSMTVEQWASATLDASPAVNSTKVGSGTPSSTLTTTQSLSAVSWMCADWSAIDPSSRVYNSTSATAVEDGLHDKSAAGAYVAYYAWQAASSPGSQTFGLTSPGGQTWSLLGVEVLDVPGPGAPEDPNQAEPLVIWQ
jgi:hypothetical protein